MNIQDYQSQFQLLCTNIESVAIKNDFWGFSQADADKRQIDVSYQIESMCPDAADPTKKSAILQLTVTLIVVAGEKECTVVIAMNGLFAAPAEMADEALRQMLSLNGCAALYTMARGTVAGITAQIFSLGNMVLPMVNFIQFHEAETADGTA